MSVYSALDRGPGLAASYRPGLHFLYRQFPAALEPGGQILGEGKIKSRSEKFPLT